MIEDLTISTVATYQGEPRTLRSLKRVNFVYGGNGSGKTTISRALADSVSRSNPEYRECSVRWVQGRQLEVLVYNSDFINRSFRAVSALRGVFTLGEENVESQRRLEEAKAEQDRTLGELAKFKEALGSDPEGTGKRGEIAAARTTLAESCWQVKVRREGDFGVAFEGHRKSKEKFLEQILKVRGEGIHGAVITLEDLTARAGVLFGPPPIREESVTQVDATLLLDLEGAPILQRPLVGSQGVDIAALIRHLGNSDWVSRGRHFLRESDGRCPFCQQATPEGFTEELEKFFDDSYTSGIRELGEIKSAYAEASRVLVERLKGLLQTPAPQLDSERLRSAVERLSALLDTNERLLTDKCAEPSRTVELRSVGDEIAAIQAVIGEANAKIAVHNELVDNARAESSKLKHDVWRFVVAELDGPLRDYETKTRGLLSAVENMTAKIARAETRVRELSQEIRKIEASRTSVQPTVDRINQVLTSFGFQGFRLDLAADGTAYRLVRPDGTPAKETLSEGEQTLVAFLYFWHLAKGSLSVTDTTTARVVVFDDPVSSLDSEVLFLVSTLIRQLCDEARQGEGQIRQVFVLTHNVYFHKEVSFSGRKPSERSSTDTYWVVRKVDQRSEVISHVTNPIKTTYDLLWDEVRNPERSRATIHNTLRRILENYFRILGNQPLESLPARFPPSQQSTCRSLIAWLHDGSHFAWDDVCLTTDDSTVDLYLEVFREIFRLTDHQAHYEMMMHRTEPPRSKDTN